jgi:hypothetical protein
MKYDYIPLNAVPTSETISDTAKVLVVDDGAVKQTAKSNVGGGSSDPYAGYDVVIATEAFSTDVADYEVIKLDYDSLLTKVRAGELVTGVLCLHYNYDADVEGGTHIEPIPLMEVYMTSADNVLNFCKVSSDIQNFIKSKRVSLNFSDEGTILQARYTLWEKNLT